MSGEPKRRRSRSLAALIAIALLLAGYRLGWFDRDRGFDRRFDTAVAEPAWRGDGPRVLFDEGHRNTHTADGGYRPFAELLRNDGYAVSVLAEPFTPQGLSGAAVLVVVCAQGANPTNDGPAFTDEEAAAVEQWVREGGALLLVTDHWPFGLAAASLAGRFGVSSGGGLVEDAAHGHPELGASHLVFSRDNGLLREHPVVAGRSPAERPGRVERVERVLTFTGQSLAGPPQATAFLALSDEAIEYPPTTGRVERDGSDERVVMDYGEPVPARGRAQGLALEHGAGRLVVLGDAGMLRAQRESGDRLVGMNHPDGDNRQLALNLVHWLTRAP